MGLTDVARLRATVNGLSWSELPSSMKVDVLQFVATGKPALRVDRGRLTEVGERSLRRWAGDAGVRVADDGLFLCLGKAWVDPTEILVVDGMSYPHERELGELLGYPGCCCAAVARVGESSIDHVARVQETWSFEGRFVAIDPTGYSTGRALISHLPCRSHCEPSLVLAEMAAEFVISGPEATSHDEPWETWLATVNTLYLPDAAVPAEFPPT